MQPLKRLFASYAKGSAGSDRYWSLLCASSICRVRPAERSSQHLPRGEFRWADPEVSSQWLSLPSSCGPDHTNEQLVVPLTEMRYPPTESGPTASFCNTR